MKGKTWRMSTIKMAHIDDHFIHGQVATRWCEALEANLIVVVNDDLASNKMRQGLLDMAVPDKINSRYYSVEKAIKQIPLIKEDKQILLITATLNDINQLVEGGIVIPRINLGSIAFEHGKRHLTNSLSLDEHDFSILESFVQLGIEIDSKTQPEDESQVLTSKLDHFIN